MSHPRYARLKKLMPQTALATAILVGAGIFAVATTARGASHRTLAAAIELTQTCSNRVEPGSRIDIEAVVQNSGDEILDIIPPSPDADAGTPDNTADDFSLTYQSGDVNNVGHLDPAEQWTYTGSYTAPTEDATNIVGVDAFSVSTQTNVSDVAPCETDVAQQPVAGVIVGVKEVSGKVLVKKAGESKFTELNGQTEIPVGSQVNTVNGTILLTASLGGGKMNSAQFYQGLFTILQNKGRNSITTLRLDGGSFRNCGSSTKSLSTELKRKRPVRRVWGSGKGRFTTRGRYSSATVRGTKWLTQDQCNGTLTKVLKGVVRVRDFRARKNVDVRAGHSYLALAPGA
jgi:hypothetical protein